MIQNKNQNILCTLEGYAMSKFLSTRELKRIDPK